MFYSVPDPEEKVFIEKDGVTSVVRRKNAKHRLLVVALGQTARTLCGPCTRPTFRKLAWSLGMEGETAACEAIMEWAKEPSPVHSAPSMYGIMT